MNEDQIQRIERRLSDIEGRLSLIERRLAVPSMPQVRASTHAAAETSPWKPTPTPPPVQYPRPSQTPVAPVAQPKASPDAEYKLGAKVLPIVGAGVFIVGIIYLVALGISRGWITIQMQWAGELALCAAFIVTGLFLRNEREEFGQILTGIGSCGLYISFAGAHVYKFYEGHRLISGETLVLLFMALSFANLGYSWLRSSKAFLTIGILGGLTGALLPLREDHLVVSGLLQLSIVGAAALITARYKWFHVAVTLAFIAGVASLPGALANFGHFEYKVAFVYANSLICLACLAWSRRKVEWDPQGALTPLVAFAAGCLGFAVQGGLQGSAHLAVFAGTLALLGALFARDKEASSRIWMGAILVLLLLTPAGYRHGAVAIYGSLAVLLSAYLYRSGSRVALFLSWMEVLFAIGAYALLDTWTRPWRDELSLDVLIAFGILATGYAHLRRFSLHPDSRSMLMLVVAMGSSGFLLRIGYLLGVQIDPLHRALMAEAYTSLTLALACSLWALRAPSGFRAGFGSALGICGALCYMNMRAIHSVRRWEEMCLLAFMSGLTFLLAKNASDLKASGGLIRGLVIPIIAVMFLQASLLAGPDFFPGIQWEQTQIYAAMLASFFLAFLTVKNLNREMPVYAWLLGLYGAAWYCFLVLTSSSMSFSEEITLLWLLMALVLGLCGMTVRISDGKGAIDFVGGLALWALFSRMLTLVLTSPSVAMTQTAAVTLAWTVYAFLLMGIGFAKHRPVLRYLSLTLFATTVGKVMVVDLSELDQGIRVVVLMLLGLAMIGGGYWYIRVRQRTEEVPSP